MYICTKVAPILHCVTKLNEQILRCYNRFVVFLSITLITKLIINYVALANLILLIQYNHSYLFSSDDYKCNITELNKAD